MTEEKNGNKYVGIKMLGIIVGLLSTFILIAIGMGGNAITQVNEVRAEVSKVKIQQSVVITNQEWMMESLKEIKSKI